METVSWMRTDPFCVSSVGTPWTDLHWGFQIMAWATHRIGSDAGLVLLRIALVAAALGAALKGRFSWNTAAIAIVGLFALRTFLDLRPLLVSLLALALLWKQLEKAPTVRTFAIAIALQIALSNMQGLFLLGPLFATAAAVGAWLEGHRRRARAMSGLVLLLVLASLANPWGWQAFDLAGMVASRILPSAGNIFSREIPENLPLHLWVAEQPARLLPLLWIAMGAWAFRRKDSGTWERALLLSGTATLSFMAVRNLPLALLAATLCIEPRRYGHRLLLPVGTTLLAAALSVPLLLERRWNDPSSWIAPLRLPSQRTLDILSRSPGPVFHEIRAGGWLSWTLPDRDACWCDTRLVLHDAVFVSDYLDILAHPGRFEAWSRERGFRFALLPVAEMPHAAPLAATLFASGTWKLLDCDGAWALFARTDVPLPAIAWTTPVGKRAIEARIAERFHDNPRLERFASSRLGEVLDQASVAIRIGAGR